MQFRVNEVNVRENAFVNFSVWSDFELVLTAILETLCRLLYRGFVVCSWKAISKDVRMKYLKWFKSIKICCIIQRLYKCFSKYNL